MMQHLERNRFAVSNLKWGILQILTRALGSFKNLHFNELFLTKLYIVWAKKVRRFDGTEDWFKIWRKTDLFLQKWHENFVRPYHEELSSKAWGMWQYERLFHLLWKPSAFEDNLTMWLPFAPLKTFFSHSVWPRRKYTWTLNWKESLLIYFRKLSGRSLFPREGIGWWMLRI